MRGANIADASHGLAVNSQGVTTGQWAVNMKFDSVGAQQFADVTRRLITLEGVRNQFAIVLDGQVITAPTTNAAITDGKAEISGNFTQESAKTLADQLKFGALPIGFEVQSREVISATLGETQLSSGVIAGLIGMILVVIYSLFQYRLLGSVTIASLVVAGILTYLVIAIMSWRMGFRLSLAGVAGLIVAIGFTADSFIVYFERIRDELRDGKSLVGAVEAGWERAFRTILAAKGVNILSAVVLFVLAIGNVRGFALTLGITTVIDVLVVVLFTHPMLQLLATTRSSPADTPGPAWTRTRWAPSTAGGRSSAHQWRRPSPRSSPGRHARRSAARPSLREKPRKPPPSPAPTHPPRGSSPDGQPHSVRKRPLHRQAVVQLRRQMPPVVHHRDHRDGGIHRDPHRQRLQLRHRVPRRFPVPDHARGDTRSSSRRSTPCRAWFPTKSPTSPRSEPTACGCRPTSSPTTRRTASRRPSARPTTFPPAK